MRESPPSITYDCPSHSNRLDRASQNMLRFDLAVVEIANRLELTLTASARSAIDVLGAFAPNQLDRQNLGAGGDSIVFSLDCIEHQVGCASSHLDQRNANRCERRILLPGQLYIIETDHTDIGGYTIPTVPDLFHHDEG